MIRHVDRFDLTAGGVMAALAVALVMVIAQGTAAGARVVAVFPEDGAALGAFGRVGVTFGQPMQARSVEARLTLTPAVPGTFQWDGQTVWFVPSQPYAPGVVYQVRLEAGAISQGQQTVRRATTWSFTVRVPDIVYLAPDTGPRELWRISSAGGTPAQITNTGGKLYDFAVAPDGEQLVYSAANEAGQLSLWRVSRHGGDARLLLDCGLDNCYVPAWSPNGREIAYSREGAGLTAGEPNGPPRVWLLELASGETAPLHADAQVIGYGPTWSPNGQSLVFYDGSAGSLRVHHRPTGREMLLPTQFASSPTWSPDSTQVYYSSVSFEAENAQAAINRADLPSQSITPIIQSPGNLVEYGPLALSPDGAWLIVSQSDTTTSGAPARQLWRMRPDGAEARPMTTEPGYVTLIYRWDPWSQAVVYQRIQLGESFPVPELWLWTPATNQTRLLVEDGAFPQWLP